MRGRYVITHLALFKDENANALALDHREIAVGYRICSLASWPSWTDRYSCLRPMFDIHPRHLSCRIDSCPSRSSLGEGAYTVMKGLWTGRQR